jgi:hypothetical protein
MATTLTDLINEVQLNLSGYTFNQDRATYLRTTVSTTVSTSASPTILELGSTENVGKGVIEVGEELMFIDSFDRISNTGTIAPWGRGYLGTTATTHALDSKVTISPTFPRYVIKKAINDTIRATGSSIFAAKSTSFVFNAAQTTYEFNNLKIQNILTIMWQAVGPSEEWIPVKRWDFDSVASTAAFGANAQTVTIRDYITSGRTVKILYATDPEAFTTNGQDFVDQTGLPESCKDVITLGASYRLLTYLDPARAAQVSPQADETDSKRPYGSSQSITRQVYTLFNQRLTEEIKNQQDKYPIRVHYSL